ncbi:hypothetical protein BO78DRAFT_184022 [Aspergillus sclerotiicarbonarius CBS 121057]|uniref:Uncharacterized protein n=1 Tax=Aspergillus sclerotiicarbonarius (strain CBS 121057 / IBT 28362) TaxID=1448318 RepID=A0A319ESL2_ASPSB|nr:hypothetical protein BO78DRAFT_184022 [Aspergillus sclerotiicarbonarius CBS 121057]
MMISIQDATWNHFAQLLCSFSTSSSVPRLASLSPAPAAFRIISTLIASLLLSFSQGMMAERGSTSVASGATRETPPVQCLRP